MPTIPAGFVEATFLFTVTGNPRTHTWSLGLDADDFGTKSAATMATDIYQCFDTTGRPYLPANVQIGWTWQGVSVTKMLESGPVIGQHLVPLVGTMVGGPLPPNSAILMAKNTNEGGRRNRGRAFLPPLHLGETGVDQAGFFPGSGAQAITDWYTAAIAELGTAGYTPVLFHASSPFTPTVITSVAVKTQIATQRRRMRS